jgi:RHS repeat-associated protein
MRLQLHLLLATITLVCGVFASHTLLACDPMISMECGRGPEERRQNHTTPPQTINFAPPAAAYQLSALPQISPSTDLSAEYKNALHFDPILDINPNRGNATTAIPLVLPDNLTSLQQIKLVYHSNDYLNRGMGSGWKWSLPAISVNPKSQLRPYIYTSAKFGGELVEVFEDLSNYQEVLDYTADLFDLHLDITGMTPYRPVVDDKYHLLIKLDNQTQTNNSAPHWLALSPTSEIYLFNQHGKLIKVADRYRHIVTFSWEGPILITIKYHQQWQMDFQYQTKRTERLVDGQWGRWPQRLGSILYRSETSESKIEFEYQQQQLTKAYYTTDDLSASGEFIFKGEYQTPTAKQVEVRGRQFGQAGQVFFHQLLEQPEMEEQSKSRDLKKAPLIIYSDLQGDGRAERITFSYQQVMKSIEEILTNLKYQFLTQDQSSYQYHPKRPMAEVLANIQQLQPQIKIEVSYYNPATKKVEWLEDKTLSYPDPSLLPISFSLEVQQSEEKKSPTFSTITHYYQLKTVSNLLQFIDLDNSGIKDLVWCPGLPSIQKEEGNPLLNDLSQGNDSAWSNINPKAGMVFKLALDEEFLQREYQKIKGYFEEGVLQNYIPGSMQWKEVDSNIKCHQYSQFVDTNQDNYLDLINSSKVLLNQGAYHFVVSDTIESKQRIEAPLHTTSGTQQLLSDLDGNGRPEVYAVDYSYIDPNSKAVVWGERESEQSTTPLPPVPLLSKLHTPYGGELQLEYQNFHGLWVVASRKQQFHDEGQHLVEWSYQYGKGAEQETYHPLTGQFLGISQTSVIKSSNFKNSPQTQFNYYYGVDTHPQALLWHARSALNGLMTKREQVTLDSQIPFSSQITDWSLMLLGSDKNRFKPLPARKSMHQQSLNDGLTYALMRTELSHTQLYNNIIPQLITTTTYSDKLRSIHRSRESDGELKATQQLQFHPQQYQLKLLSTATEGAKMGVRATTNYNYSQKLELVSQCIESRCQLLNYDRQGRVNQLTDTWGKPVRITYLTPESKAISTLSDPTQKLTYDNYHLTLKRPLTITSDRQIEYRYQYSPSGRLLQLDRIDPDYGAGTLFQQTQYSTEDRLAVVNDRGIVRELLLNGFGRTVEERWAAGEQTFIANKILQDEAGNTLLNFLPQFNESTKVQQHFSYDSAGRLSLIQSDDGDQRYSYDGHCSTHTFAQTITTGSCQDSFGHPYRFWTDRDHIQFQVDESGAITALSESKARWSRNSFGEIVSTIMQYGDQGQAPWKLEKISYDWSEKLKTITGNDFKLALNRLGMPASYQRSKAAAINDIYFTYQQGLLAKVSYSGPKGVTLNKKIEYDSLKQPIKYSMFNNSFALSYDYYGRIESEQHNSSDETIKLEYHREGPFLTALTPLITAVRRDRQGRVSEIEYQNDLEISINYQGNTELIKKIAARHPTDPKLYRNRTTYNQGQQVERITTKSKLQDNYSLRVEKRPSIKPQVSYRRNSRGEVVEHGEYTFSFVDNNLSVSSSLEQSFRHLYNHQGEWIGSCPLNSNIRSKCALFLDRDHLLINQTMVSLIRFNKLPAAVAFQNELYPVITNHQGSVVAMFAPTGDKLLWERRFDIWGNKKVILNPDFPIAAKMEAVTVWSYAGLRHNPFMASTPLYWSHSRIYSAQIKEWLSVDPLLKWNPNKLIGSGFDWMGVRYCNNDPVNFVDPSGLSVIDLNRQLGGSKIRSIYNPISHTFLATTQTINGKEIIESTYSWGNTGTKHGKRWAKDAMLDMTAATQALRTGDYKRLRGGEQFEKHLAEIMMPRLNDPSHRSNNHSNKWFTLNCKNETYDALNEARTSYRSEYNFTPAQDTVYE